MFLLLIPSIMERLVRKSNEERFDEKIEKTPMMGRPLLKGPTASRQVEDVRRPKEEKAKFLPAMF